MHENDTLAAWKLERLMRSFRDQARITQELEGRTIGSARLLRVGTKTGEFGRIGVDFFGVFAAFVRTLSKKFIMIVLDEARSLGLSANKRHFSKHISACKLAVIIASPMITNMEVAASLDASLITFNAALATDGHFKSPYATSGTEKSTKKIAQRLKINDQ